jgi:hypothetical protein
MASIGLILIITAWILQLFTVSATDKNMKPLFVALYCIGVLVLVVDGIMGKLYTLALLNFVSFLTAGLVFLKLRSKV